MICENTDRGHILYSQQQFHISFLSSSVWAPAPQAELLLQSVTDWPPIGAGRIATGVQGMPRTAQCVHPQGASLHWATCDLCVLSHLIITEPPEVGMVISFLLVRQLRHHRVR